MDLDSKLSCDVFIPSNTSSSQSTGMDYLSSKRCPYDDIQSKSSTHASEQKCPSVMLSSTSSSTITSGLFGQNCHIPKRSQSEAPNITYELEIAKAIMKRYSTISGDNLFDHLSDIIKRVIDERPPNVIDFFEEFSRNVREQKLHLPERFPPGAVYEENRLYKIAKKQLLSMNLPYTDDDVVQGEGLSEELEEQSNKAENIKAELKLESLKRFHTFYERVQHLHFFWNQCGFSISSEDIFQLACSMSRLQTHPSIRQCRFWGMISGLKASYYVVEAYLSNEEIVSRALQMQKEISENQWKLQEHTKTHSHIGPELTPGAVGWENYPTEELAKMKPTASPVPVVQPEELFDIPPEIIGYGVNRYTYFVVNSLADDWIELPICTPKQIQISRQIKKFLTGDLESDVVSYPCFPGKEKHYLRAQIARITAGTHIAPRGYYRKMTKNELRLFEGVEDEEIGEEEDENETSISEDEEEEDEGEPDNDIVLLKDDKYQPPPLNTLNHPSQWLHIRPNILQQGRVVWFDEEQAHRERQKEIQKLRLLQEKGMKAAEEEDNSEEVEDEDESEGEEEEEVEEINPLREVGPAILTSCSQDRHEETPVPWVGRYTSNYTNKNERILVMRSNIWPGAYTFVFEGLCDSIYLGWGYKNVARNMAWQHMAQVAEEFPHDPMNFIETNDPDVEMEEAYRLSLIKKELKDGDINDQGYENETDDDQEDDDDSDDDEEEEEEEEEE